MSDSLLTLSETMAGIVDTVGDAVVQVSARRRLPASGVLWSQEGLVVTAHHVVKASDISVKRTDGSAMEAELVGRDPSTDLALLRVKGDEWRPADWNDENLAVGHLVLALARPGRTVQATMGIVSALGDAWRAPAGGQIERYLQTDVLMYPGFSGGPLVGMGGQVLGINTSALVRGTSITVPAVTVRRVVDSLLTHGRVKRGYLGISTQLARLPADLRDELGQATGLLIVAVEPDSPAGAAGFVLGDTIVSLDGTPVRHHDDLVNLLSGDRVGRKVPVGVVRGGEAQTHNVTIGERT